MQINGAVRTSSLVVLGNSKSDGDRVFRVLPDRKESIRSRLREWKEACINANDNARGKQAQRQTKNSVQERKEKEKLEKELARKEKALAEAAALLVLRKKADAIWGTDEEDE